MVIAQLFVSVQCLRETPGKDHLILGHTGRVNVASCSSQFRYSSGLFVGCLRDFFRLLLFSWLLKQQFLTVLQSVNLTSKTQPIGFEAQ